MSGQTATATFVLETIASLSALRQSITTTISHSTTSADGSVSIETEVAVIMAGGVVWAAAGVAGDAAAIEAGIEAPEVSEGHSDDTTCPEPKTRCTDCTAIAGMCTTGNNQGCACEDHTCPTEKPQCLSCNGQDGKCQGGDDDGCDCQEFSCPDGPDTPLCSECGGGEFLDDFTVCLGGMDGDELVKGCQCVDDADLGSDPDDWPVIDLVAIQQAIDNLPDITADSFATDPQNVDPTCQNYDTAAPQRDGDASAGTSSVASAFTRWCTDMDGHTVTKTPGVDTAFSLNKFESYAFWLSANNWYDAPETNRCEDTAVIHRKECIESFDFAMSTCDPNSGSTHGAAFPGECIYYNITIDRDATDTNNPPWNRLPVAATSGACDRNDISELSSVQFSNFYTSFCSSIGGDNAALTKHMTQNDWADPETVPSVPSARLLKRAPSSDQPELKYGNDWNFDFKWSGGNGAECRKNCRQSFDALTKGPCGTNGDEQDTMASSGSFDAGCGTYSYTISPPDKNQHWCQALDHVLEGQQETGYSVSDGEDAIDKFCSNTYMKVSKPATRDGNFYQFEEDADKSPEPDRLMNYGSTRITIAANFFDTVTYPLPHGIADCPAEQDFILADREDDCKLALRTAMNSCYTDTTTDKRSSVVVQHNDYGCVLYQIISTINNAPPGNP